jgi:hypothetical protein
MAQGPLEESGLDPVSAGNSENKLDKKSAQGQMISYYMQHPVLSPLLLTHIRLMAAHEENYTYCIHLNQQILKNKMGVSD